MAWFQVSSRRPPPVGAPDLVAADGIVWTPDAATLAGSTVTAFLDAVGTADWETLLARADADPAWFWEAWINFAGLRFRRPWTRMLDLSDGNPWARWCIDGGVNIADNCLDRHLDAGSGGRVAIIAEYEDGASLTWTYDDLGREVARCAEGLRAAGIGPGDVVALFQPNLAEAAAATLAVFRIGAILLPLFSGFAAPAIAARLNDAGAKAVIAVDGTFRRGRPIAMKPVLDEALADVPTVHAVIVLRRLGGDTPWTAGRDVWWHDLPAKTPGDSPVADTGAEDPAMLVHTSGTTGRPKGTVHSHCGFLAKSTMDFRLCLDLRPDDRFLWMSDMGWLVGPLGVVTTLATGATLVLAEGAPDWPQPGRLYRLVDDWRVSWLGVAPTVIRAQMQHGPEAIAGGRDLGSLRVVASTGEPWTPEAWMWMFRHICRERVPLLNYAGGTEVGGGILTGTVNHPLKPCAFAGPVPGTGASIFGPDGRPAADGTVGELVMTVPSIGLTRGLWRDRERYLESYWTPWPEVWRHGDWAVREADGMWYILGRSDDTINVAGKRTGPAEIEALIAATGRVSDVAAVGVPDDIKGTAVVCVCVPMPGETPGETLDAVIAGAVVAGLGPPFRPREIAWVDDLPKTRNMKVMRRVVRAVWQGEDPGDLGSLVNPEAVEALAGTLAARRRD